MSHEKNILSMKYWLFGKDPYTGLWNNPHLVGGFNPFEKWISQNGNLPQIGMNKKNIWNHYLAI